MAFGGKVYISDFTGKTIEESLMKNIFEVRAFKNKKTGQISMTLPKKKLKKNKWVFPRRFKINILE